MLGGKTAKTQERGLSGEKESSYSSSTAISSNSNPASSSNSICKNIS
jgi:hypothetical protein